MTRHRVVYSAYFITTYIRQKELAQLYVLHINDKESEIKRKAS